MRLVMSPEQNAFLEKLFRESINNLILYATSVLRDATKAKDIVQDTFHEAVLHLEDKHLMTHENPGGWLMETLKNKIKENNRAQERYLHRVMSVEPDVLATLAPPDDSFDRLACKLILEEIGKVLTPEEMYLLERLTLDQASHLEVSKELGITVWTSQKRLQYIREKLRKAFPEWKKKK